MSTRDTASNLISRFGSENGAFVMFGRDVLIDAIAAALTKAIADERERVIKIVNRFSICRDHDQPSHCVECDLRHRAIAAIRRDDTADTEGEGR